MALIKQTSIQRHPILWGLHWATCSFALASLIQYEREGSLPNFYIAAPVWLVAGIGWGFSMKWAFNRMAGRS